LAELANPSRGLYWLAEWRSISAPPAAPLEDLADAFHDGPVEGDVVDVEAVDPDVADEPVEPLDVGIVPAGRPARDERRVLDLRHEQPAM